MDYRIERNNRPLSEYELDASKEYDRLIHEKIPGTNRRYCDYYMPSILENFPHIKAAFDKMLAARTFYELTNTRREEENE